MPTANSLHQTELLERIILPQDDKQMNYASNGVFTQLNDFLRWYSNATPAHRTFSSDLGAGEAQKRITLYIDFISVLLLYPQILIKVYQVKEATLQNYFTLLNVIFDDVKSIESSGLDVSPVFRRKLLSDQIPFQSFADIFKYSSMALYSFWLEKAGNERENEDKTPGSFLGFKTCSETIMEAYNNSVEKSIDGGASSKRVGEDFDQLMYRCFSELRDQPRLYLTASDHLTSLLKKCPCSAADQSPETPIGSAIASFQARRGSPNEQETAALRQRPGASSRQRS